mgnify:CR=1 FL=1
MYVSGQAKKGLSKLTKFKSDYENQKSFYSNNCIFYPP